MYYFMICFFNNYGKYLFQYFRSFMRYKLKIFTTVINVGNNVPSQNRQEANKKSTWEILQVTGLLMFKFNLRNNLKLNWLLFFNTSKAKIKSAIEAVSSIPGFRVSYCEHYLFLLQKKKCLIL